MVNLYPPIIDTYMPAFIILQDRDQSDIYCDIYFSISDYNSLAGIGSVWVSIANQYTNVSVLKEPTGLKKIDVSQIGIDSSRPGKDKYRIRIHGFDLVEGWRLNEVYKVQLRFCSKLDIKNEMSDIIKNQSFFSEWSTVCLIQGILKPVFNFVNLDTSTGTETVLTSIGNHITGYLDFNNTDALESYNIKLYETDHLDKVLLESEDIFTDIHNPNEVNHILKYEFLDDVRYELHFNYRTEKMYEGFQVFTFRIKNKSSQFFTAKVEAKAENPLGRIKVKVITEENFFGNLVIRRTSSESDFKIWEDVHINTFVDGVPLDYTWFDYTIQSGVLYHYCVQKVDNIGGRGQVIKTEQPVMMVFDDMFLVGENRQLNIKFNPQVSSFSHTVVDSSIQTIGSKYPFIKRNAHVNYKQFQISGLISYLGDREEYYYNEKSWLPDELVSTFASKEECYGKYLENYLDFNSKNRISEYNDFTLERAFRDRVAGFLYDGKVKLFKSASEGNVLVRLMNISLSPEQQTGRMLYSFNATAYEIGECTIDNFDKYGIQTVGSYIDSAVKKHIRENVVFEKDAIYNNDRLMSFLQSRESLNGGDQTVCSAHAITDLTINFDSSQAYPINLHTMQPDHEVQKPVGFLIQIDGSPILVKEQGYYHIGDVNISDVVFIIPQGHVLNNVKFKVTYTVNEVEDTSQTTYKESYYYKVGQYEGTIRPGTDVLDFLRSQYNFAYDLSYQKLKSLTNLMISAPPNTVFQIKMKGEVQSVGYIIGATGILSFPSDDYEVEELLYIGPDLAYVIFDYKYEIEKGLYSNEQI